MKLFCFSYAGGSAMFYGNWKDYFQGVVSVIPMELPGRGSRFTEPLCRSIEEMVDDAFNKVRRQLDGSAYILFGHSMGTIVVTELINRLLLAGYYEPQHVFLSGRFPPHLGTKRPISEFPEEQFIDEIYRIGGTPRELIENKELFQMFIPILRADYRALETYSYRDRGFLWNSDITVLTGEEDATLTESDNKAWKNYTLGSCSFIEFPGGHFYLFEQAKSVTTLINETLLSRKYAERSMSY
ncbi:alpha/beta fold hydrolase [Paenibacillus sp. FSL P4-0338]|uniref:thioesterase II family protein n=1 Tax=unclassified Paenibacillus TaxID=185978 RepID=UPI0003E285B5|nr:alpha/beta fold hydrolase [Paenibacillus sp. FSL R7-269]ETT49790.1 putative thioesterase involved in non-ribosomal peptide biosynthesis [Paenibacillus sp. FSL R7-269]